MKKFILIFLVQMALVMQNSFGQNKEQASLYLSNYTFSRERPEVGLVQVRSANGDKIKAISLAGAQAGAFKVGRDHKLSVRKEKLPVGASSLEVVLQVKTTAGELQDTFRIVQDQFIRNKVVAHRGAWKNTGAAENSIAALNHAIALGCEGSEFDVHMSADAVPFINHDPDIQGLSIARTPASQLHQVKLANGESLPTLEAYLKAGMQQTKTKLILEIKPSALGKESSLALARRVVQLVEQLQAQAWVDYISFDYDVCREVMQLAPYARVAYLNGDKAPAELAQNKFFGLDYHYNVLLKKNPDWIKEARQKRLTVNVWTVNEKAMMETLLSQNVDFITTNEPELLLNLVSGK